ncbi:neuronal acetylcholine receptor subunit alpha-9-II-like [Antedon mediterranea]|uniref:neuronal acetylcholine receptor subunit alpha-9-II-like n=1 Tax=Antedon mediterranea TaxID=105859 RepID=UPI003AF73958
MNFCKILTLIIFSLHSAVHLLAQNSESDLIRELLENYIHPTARPVRDPSTNVTVVLRLLITQVIEVSENRQEMTISGWYKMTWKDEFMLWNPEDYNNITAVFIQQSALWIPDVTLYNKYEMTFFTVESVRAEIRVVDDEFERTKTSLNLKVGYTGEVVLATPIILTSFCKMDMTYFPLDEQKCSLEFAGWVYHGSQEDVIPDTSDESTQTEFNPNGIWNLNTVTVEYIQTKYNCCPEVYPKVVYTLILRRRQRFFVEVILLPCCLLSALTMFVFLLPPESGEKMSFGVTTLLAILLFQQMIAEALPPSADSTPIIQSYFTMLICMSCISIVCTAFVLNLYNRGHTSQVPEWLKKLLFGKVGKAIGRTKLSSVYFNQHVSNKAKHTTSPLDADILEEFTENNYVNTISSKQNGCVEERVRNSNLSRMAYSSKELKLILNELQTYLKEKKKDKMRNAIMDDWRRVAIFVDRVLFLTSLLIIIIATIIVIVLISSQ